MPHRIVIASCSHPSLPQPLWPIISSRQPAAFVWGGDAIYADIFRGLDWKSVGLRRDKDTNKWRFTFPPPSIHEDATPEIIRGWYEKQWEEQVEYRRFVEGSGTNGSFRPLVFGTVDDHDYGANNGDVTYRFRRESNLEFIDFLYNGVPDGDTSSSCDLNENDNNVCNEENSAQTNVDTVRIRNKANDPMYQRAAQGKGVFGVQLFDFSRDPKASSYKQNDDIKWGGGYWVPEYEAKIDPDVIYNNESAEPSYSTTHSVAIFVLDVRSNKTPWPKKNKHETQHDASKSSTDTPAHDFLGEHQWTWFKSALSNSHAAINIIVSGLQIHPHRFPNDGNIVEEWSKFPEAQQLLYNTVLKSGVRSPLFVSGDVHMSQILRKDCIRKSEIMNLDKNTLTRPLIEVTTSGMTHSWGTSFSSQPKHHRFPLKLYSHFISPTFMTLAHYVIPWRDLVIKSADDVEQEIKEGWSGGKVGKQFELGLNFGEFEFDFGENSPRSCQNNNEDCESDKQLQGGAVTVRIFGKEAHQSPKLEMRWTFDQLSGKAHLAGRTASPKDFMTTYQNRNYHGELSTQNAANDEWVCVPYRGFPHVSKIYASNFIMFIVFCSLFFMPHMAVIAFFIVLRKRWRSWKQIGKESNGLRVNGNGHVNES